MKNNEYKEAVIYCRVSHPRQKKEGSGLGSQETRCREFAGYRDYDIVGVYGDDITGAASNRAGLAEMLIFLRQNRGMVVIIDDISRLARERDVYWPLRKSIARTGAKLESPSVKFGEDADSEFFESILVELAQHQRRKNAEQTKNRMRARALNGYWTLQAPVGFKYVAVEERGKMLMRDEPVASVVQEALEGYASGRFATQADVMRFLQDDPLFPKDSRGIVRHQRVAQLLSQCLYAGYLEMPRWGVSLRPAQHQALISFKTYQRIQDRLRGGFYAPRRKNVSEDFPLRGYVECADCGTPLTACWSKGSHSRHPYYLCPKRGCESYGKSIRRTVIEGEFEDLLHAMTPSEGLSGIVVKMLRKLWDHQQSQGATMAKALSAQLIKIERQAATLLERIIDAQVPSVIAAYEERIRALEEEKVVVRERIATTKRPAQDFDKKVRTALGFLASPCHLWRSERLEDKKTVLKLAFAKRLQYRRGEGFRTANLALPFKVLAQISGAKADMAHPARFERAASTFGGWRSIQLSYGCINVQIVTETNKGQSRIQ